MQFPFIRRQTYIADDDFELFAETRKRRNYSLILLPLALLALGGTLVLYKQHLEQDSAMQEALTSQKVAGPVLLSYAGAAEAARTPGPRETAPQVVQARPAEAGREQQLRRSQEALAEREAGNRRAVEHVVHGWKTAWEASDVNAYLSHYSPEFVPPDGSSLQQWKAERSKRVGAARNIEIALSNLDIRFKSPDLASVAFDQDYRSKSYTDKTHKVLLVRQHESGWKIEREMAD